MRDVHTDGVRRWFTEADRAELDVVAWALTDCIRAHKESCSTCRQTGRFCPRLGATVDAALDWAYYRALRSKADALRKRHLTGALEALSKGRAA